MGEATSIVPLIRQLLERYPDLHILLTTVTVTSARNIAHRLPEKAFHQFAPIDTPSAIRRFLAHWNPDTAFWVESEFWPNMMLMTRKSGCRMCLLNARISQQSAERWYQLRPLIQMMLESFELILAKSDRDAARLKNLGAYQVEVKGNLKFSSPALEADPKVTSDIVQVVGDRPRWLAASTHPGEEAMMAEMHQQLKESFPSLLTVIVPRHADRGGEIARELRNKGLKVARRSKEEPIDNDTDIYLADTMGELGIFYRLSGIVFIGGSLVAHGGQNPFEPARLDCAILYGPHMENFTEFCQELESAEGAVRIQNTDELAVRIDDLLRDHDRQEKLAEAAFLAVKAKEKVIDDVLEAICPLIDPEFTLKEAEEEAQASTKKETSGIAEEVT